MRNFTKKRAALNRSAKLLEKAYLEAHPECEAMYKDENGDWMPVSLECDGVSTEVHHMRRPKVMFLLDVRTFLAVSRPCHDWIQTHLKEAKKLGLDEGFYLK